LLHGCWRFRGGNGIADLDKEECFSPSVLQKDPSELKRPGIS
jgi:hypothetical protein